MRHHIAKLVKDGLYVEAIVLYTRHHSASIPPTNFTFPYILKACAELKATSHGQMLHAHLLKSGYTNKHTTTDLTNMYMKLGLIDSAAKLFDEIPNPSLSILNVVISGFLQNGLLEEGFRVFKNHSVPNLRLDSVTVASVGSACVSVVDGSQLHCLAVKIGVERDEYAATTFMKMYLNCKELGFASKLFETIENKNLVCYNAYLSGLAQNGVVEIVLRVFKEMRGLLHEKPNVITLISLLSACGNGEHISFGKQLHGLIVKIELFSDTNVGTGLVDMYSKCGSWKCAYRVFQDLGNNKSLITWNSMISGMMLNDQSETAISLFAELESEFGLKPDSATWNSMISGFSQLGKSDESFLFFRKMLSCAVKPNVRCLTSLLSTCSLLSSHNHGKEIHGYVARMNMIDDEFLATAIIDMYMKCGLPFLARNVFNLFDKKPNDPAFWNAMISGYGKNGDEKAAFDIFDQLVEERVKPNLVTFSCLLSVCSYTGRVEKGFEFFRLMTVKFGLSPSSKHMSILIDLLGRSGRLDEAFEILRATGENSASVLASLLGSSEHYLNSKLGEEMARRILELEPENPIAFVVLSNIYAGQERWKDVHKIRKLMDEKGLRKMPGLSSLGVA
ncbi:pentatricopeptide repeat-containing protein at2g02750 [Phtheirospermum japonicum]|uniref:Pentatricopeptide repeat-containing protein at2g02750 n=1 Tax=Phtheirospermum japonicum TaxID=374723 RepID=A0A830BVL8_9LAMI|nr:pentatricopeptide repeat-containing protein at2g02750 [Phtheirospermum japonicum]